LRGRVACPFKLLHLPGERAVDLGFGDFVRQ